jgi:hypothetical protein
VDVISHHHPVLDSSSSRARPEQTPTPFEIKLKYIKGECLFYYFLNRRKKETLFVQRLSSSSNTKHFSFSWHSI